MNSYYFSLMAPSPDGEIGMSRPAMRLGGRKLEEVAERDLDKRKNFVKEKVDLKKFCSRSV